MAAAADDFGAALKRARPPQYLGQGSSVRALGESPMLASEPDFWTIQVDSLRADGSVTRRNNAGDGQYSDNAWYEMDIPFGWIPAEISTLAVSVVELSATPFRNTGITFADATPWAYSTAVPSGAVTPANVPLANPTFVPFYARPGSMATAASVSFMDSGCHLAMTVRGSSRGLPRFLSSVQDDYVSLGSWSLRTDSADFPAIQTDQSMNMSLVQISNPSGGTLRFEQRLLASNAMPSLKGAVSTAETVTQNYGFPAWRVTLRLSPIQSAQYGGVAAAPERQFVG